MTTSGYLHGAYAASFAGIGEPLELPHCGGWVLMRDIPGSPLRDGMGCYPLFACRDWSRLSLDLPSLADLVSLTVVADPFGNVTEAGLRAAFGMVRPYKQHYVVDLGTWSEDALPRRHRRNVTTSSGRVHVEVCPEPLRLSHEWVSMYRGFVTRRRLSGIAALSPEALEGQLSVPGLVMFSAHVGSEIVGLHLWFIQGDVAYGHLGATTDRGRELMASYALYQHAFRHLRGVVNWLDLGAGPGVVEDAGGEGLRLFKAGWSTGVRWAYLCGHIFQPEAYEGLLHARGTGSTGYFPAYRAGENSSGGPHAAGLAS